MGDGFTWRRQGSFVDIEEDTLDDQLRERITSGAQSLRADAFVKVLFVLFGSCLLSVYSSHKRPHARKVNDPHLEAKGAVSNLELGNIGDRSRSARLRHDCEAGDGFGCCAFAQRLSTCRTGTTKA